MRTRGIQWSGIRAWTVLTMKAPMRMSSMSHNGSQGSAIYFDALDWSRVESGGL
jgi:hypothetical protein